MGLAAITLPSSRPSRVPGLDTAQPGTGTCQAQAESAERARGKPVVEFVVRVVGAVAGIAGTWVTGSDGWRLVWREAMRLVCKARVWLARFRWLRFLKPEPIAAAISPASEVSAAGRATWDVHRRAWDPTASVSAKLQWLRKNVDAIETDLNSLRKALSDETEQRSAAIRQVRSELSEDLTELRRVVAETERRTVEVDARGLPLIAIGLAFTALPDVISHYAVVGWLASPVAAVMTIWLVMVHTTDERALRSQAK